jgi:uncharacterized protein (DUF2249 family)/quercetin dioxygenase-like cupin family protein
MTMDQLDVRHLRKPDKHPTIFATYDALEVGDSFVLVNNHDPVHLRDEFEIEHPGGFGWSYLESGPGVWRIQVSKLASTPLPRLLCHTALLASEDSDAAGAVWSLRMRDRALDSNVIRLPPDGTIDTHAGPDVDVLVHVISGSGLLGTERGDVVLEAGALVWLPRRSVRQFTAGPEGLGYLTVHQRRQALAITG